MQKQQPPISGKRTVGRPFPKGVSGNPAGRPKGSKHKLAESVYRDIAADWEKHGAEAITATREKDPSVYLRVVATIMPKDVAIEVTKRSVREYDTGELEQLLRQSLQAEQSSISN